MSVIDFPAATRRAQPVDSHASARGEHPVLVMRPEGFFSHRYRLHLEPAEPRQQPGLVSPSPRADRGDLGALRMTLLIAVPFLLYWVVSSVP